MRPGGKFPTRIVIICAVVYAISKAHQLATMRVMRCAQAIMANRGACRMGEQTRSARLHADSQRRPALRAPTATTSQQAVSGSSRDTTRRLRFIWAHGGEIATLAFISLISLWGATRVTSVIPPHSPRNAIPIVVTLNIGAALLVPYLRRRLHLNAPAVRGLPDPLYTLYLATLILVGVRTAVALAIVTPFASDAPFALWALIRRGRLPSARMALRRLTQLLRHATSGAVIIWVAALVYIAISVSLRSLGLSVLVAHIPAALAAATLTLLCICALRLGAAAYDAEQASASFGGGRLWANRARLWALCRGYLESPMFRYQALLLCACPLLPVVEAIDDVVAELAWVLFLAPLCAVYYLSLLSVRLQQRTNELQLTVEELGAARLREAELQDYAALITQAQEDERRRLARELHDDTAQALVALARGLDSLTVPSARSPSAPGEPAGQATDLPAPVPMSMRGENGASGASDARFIAELGAMARQALENVRRACRDLRPSVLDDLGLAAALDALSADMNRRGLPCVFHMSGVERAYPSTVEVTIYRIAQEALSNALHHADPTQARLELTYEADAICLVVSDNGRGFDYMAQLRKARLARDSAADAATDPAADTHAGFGLLGMRERAALIGATLDIQSVRGLGARLTLVARAPGGLGA